MFENTLGLAIQGKKKKCTLMELGMGSSEYSPKKTSQMIGFFSLKVSQIVFWLMSLVITLLLLLEGLAVLSSTIFLSFAISISRFAMTRMTQEKPGQQRSPQYWRESLKSSDYWIYLLTSQRAKTLQTLQGNVEDRLRQKLIS